MKLKSFLLSIVLFCAAGSTAAQDFYKDGVPVYSNGITYDVEVDFLSLLLTNEANSLINGTWTYLDGSVIKSDKKDIHDVIY